MNTPNDIIGVRDKLRSLLQADAKSRPSDWEDQVARSVGLLAVDFPVQPSDEIALEEMALVTLAAQKGSKSAKVRTLNTTRWKLTSPPPLAGLLHEGERKAALKWLRRIRAPWVMHYGLAEFANEGRKAIRPDLVAWIASNAATAAQVLEAWANAQERLAVGFRSQISELASTFLKCAAFIELPPGPLFLEAIHRILFIADPTSDHESPTEDKKARLRLQAVLTELLIIGTSKDPRFFLTPAFRADLAGISALVMPIPRAIAVRKAEILGRAARTLALLYSVADGQAREDVAQASRALMREHEVYRRVLQELLEDEPGIAGLLRDETTPRAVRSEGALEEAVGVLISEVDDLCRRYPSDLSIQQLKSRVDAVSSAAKVREFGIEGEELSYDPLRHILADATKNATTVRVKRPGVVAVRDDGSLRVLLKAVVESTSRAKGE